MTENPKPETPATEVRLPFLFYLSVAAAMWMLAGNFPSTIMPHSLAAFVGEAALTISGMWMFIRYRAIPANQLVRSFLLLWTILLLNATVSILWSQDPNATVAKLHTWYATTLALAAFVLFGTQRKEVLRLFWAILIGISTGALHAFWQSTVGFAQLAQNLQAQGFSQHDIWIVQSTWRGFGPFISPNIMGGAIAVGVMLVAVLFINYRSRLHRALLVGMSVAMLLGLYATASRGATLVLLAELGLLGSMLGFRRWGKRFLLVAAVLGVVAAMVAGMLLFVVGGTANDGSLFGRFANMTDMLVSTSSRLRYFEAALNAAAAFFPLGCGFGAYPAIAKAFNTSAVFAADPHDIYLLLLAELGVSGLLLLLAAVLMPVVVWARRLHRQWSIELATIGVAYVGLLLHASFELTAVSAAWVLILMLLGASLILWSIPETEQPKPQAASAPNMIQAVGVILVSLLVMVISLMQSFEVAMLDDARTVLDLPAKDSTERIQNTKDAVSLANSALKFWKYDPRAYIFLAKACRMLPQPQQSRLCPDSPERMLDHAAAAIPLDPEPVAEMLSSALDESQPNPKRIESLCNRLSTLHPMGLKPLNVCMSAMLRLGQTEAAARLDAKSDTLVEQYLRYKNRDTYAVFENLLISASIAQKRCNIERAKEKLSRIIELANMGLSTRNYLAPKDSPLSAQQFANIAMQALRQVEADAQTRCKNQPK